MTRIAWAALVACIILLPAALTPLVGSIGVVISGLLAVAALLAAGVGRWKHGTGWLVWLPVLLALLGSIVGVSSALAAFAATAADREYAARVGFGWLALLWAIVAVIAGVLAVSRPRQAGVVLLLGSLASGIAINLFYINTWYVGAVLLWWLGALVALVAPKRRVHA